MNKFKVNRTDVLEDLREEEVEFLIRKKRSHEDNFESN